MPTPKQLKLLKSISRDKVVRTNKNDMKDIDYLYNLGWIEYSTYDKDDDFAIFPYITEQGKSALYTHTKDKRTSTIALVFSIIALVVSLLTAFTPFADSSKKLLSDLVNPNSEQTLEQRD